MADGLFESAGCRAESARAPRAWTRVAFGLVLALLLLGFVGSSLHYPYYHLWDGDAVPCIDTLLIRSGQPPAHVHHTAFGVYLILVPLAWAGHALGWISLGNLTDLESSLSPYGSVAEFMACLKLAYPFVVLVLLLALWGALVRAFRPRPLTALLLLAFLGSQEVMFWGASMIRSETASITYWALALLFLVLAADATRFAHAAGYIFGAGVLLGLAFLTKIQAAPYVAVAALCFLWMLSLKQPETALPPPSSAAQRATALLACCTLLVFLLVGWAAWKMPLEISGAMVGEQTYFWAGYRGASFTLFRGAGFPIALTLAVLAVAALGLLRRQAAPPFLRAALYLTATASAGFVAVLFLHLLFFSSLADGWHYLLVDFKTAFLRGREQFTDTSLNRNRLDLLRMLEHFKWTLVLHLALSGALAVGGMAGRVAIPRPAAALTGMLSALLLLITVFFVRFSENDMIWVQIPFNLLSLCFAGILIRYARVRQRAVAAAVSAAFTALFFVNVAGTATIHRRIDMNYAYFGWKDFWVMQGIFGGHRPYDQRMKTFYTTDAMADEGYRQAIRFQENRRLANFILQNQRVPMMNIGSIFESYPVWREARDYRIQSCSPYVREALAVDSQSLPRRDFALYDKELMRKHHSVPEKFEARSGKDTVVLAIRADADTLLFVHESEVAQALNALNEWRRPIAEATPYRITLSNGTETIAQAGIRILNYAELPVAALSKPWFVVLVKRHTATP